MKMYSAVVCTQKIVLCESGDGGVEDVEEKKIEFYDYNSLRIYFKST
jgi:hypothetical protein